MVSLVRCGAKITDKKMLGGLKVINVQGNVVDSHIV